MEKKISKSCLLLKNCITSRFFNNSVCQLKLCEKRTTGSLVAPNFIKYTLKCTEKKLRPPTQNGICYDFYKTSNIIITYTYLLSTQVI